MVQKRFKDTAESQNGRENFYLYSAVNPRNGESSSILAPYTNTQWMNLFLKQMSKDLTNQEAFVVMDCASWHKSKDLRIPKNVTIIYLPLYSPELNPIERLWQYLKNNLMKNRMCHSIKLLEDALYEFILKITKDSIKTTCSVNYLTFYV